MKRSDLVRSVQVKFNRMWPEDADRIITALCEHITNSVAEGNRIEIRGFGRFMPRVRATKEAFNPRTGMPMRLAAGRTILFRPSNELTKKMN